MDESGALGRRLAKDVGCSYVGEERKSRDGQEGETDHAAVCSKAEPRVQHLTTDDVVRENDLVRRAMMSPGSRAGTGESTRKERQPHELPWSTWAPDATIPTSSRSCRDRAGTLGHGAAHQHICEAYAADATWIVSDAPDHHDLSGATARQWSFPQQQ